MVLNFRETRQAEAAECGLACLSIASGLLGAPLSMVDLRRRHGVSQRGLTLKAVGDIASSLGMASRAVRCEVDEIKQLKCPAILHWEMTHFVVLERVIRGRAHVIDPARGPRTVDEKELSRSFSGVALEVTASPGFQRRRQPPGLKAWALFSWSAPIKAGLLQILILSIILQVYVIVSPFYMQIAIDQAAATGDRDLLIVLAVGFGLFGAFNAGADLLRSFALRKVSAMLEWDMTQRVFQHLIRLPLPWFQRRKLSDVLTRFDSLNAIKEVVSGGIISSLIDGLLSIVTVIAMYFYAPPLALVAVVGAALLIAVRASSIGVMMKLGMASLSASIVEQGKKIETLRAIQTIKVMAAETARTSDWANRFAETIRTRQNAAGADIGFNAVLKLIESTSLVLIVYLGVKSILDGKLTIGILYAFIAYRSQFMARVQSLFENVVQWRMLDISLNRLSDIALNPVEAGIDRSPVGLPQLRGALTLRGVSFRYAAHEQEVLSNISLKIDRGEYVAIVGPSGGGKSTLLKVLCGLYPASFGQIIIDDFPIDTWGPKTIRGRFGIVMQDDELLSGSIAENVAFFDDTIDIDRVWSCLRTVRMDEEVNRMPMRADSLVGDMGSTLSGGQKQRVLLARALYKDPCVLVLDEATSHLDLHRERAINDALKDLRITRIIVAHRPETIASADRVIVLDQGKITGDHPAAHVLHARVAEPPPARQTVV